MMIKLMTQLLFALMFSLSALTPITAHALDSQLLPDIKPGIATIQTQDPERSVGYTVGDVLTRHLIITIKKPYQLIPESLPIVGYQKRYRGQVLGIDLSEIKHTAKDDGDKVIHDLTVSYQVFTNKTVVKHGALPTEYLHIINVNSKGKDVVKLRIPSFEFVISPISVFGQVKIEDDISGFRGPLLLDNSLEKKRLKTLLTIGALSLLGLLYMLGKHAWLPRMGGPFAKSYRLIRKQENTPQDLQNAVASMHSALNTTAGNSLFSGNLDAFFAKKPAFKAIETEFEQFFGLSRQVFFEPNASHQVGNDPIQWLAQFCRRCRDCERGLVPDAISAKQ
jgi:mxaA protein